MVFKAQRRMIVNPYPYEGEAYNSWAIMIEDRENGIYKPFMESHIEKPWNNAKLTVTLTKHFTEELRKADAEEHKFAEDEAVSKSSEADKKDERLIESIWRTGYGLGGDFWESRMSAQLP